MSDWRVETYYDDSVRMTLYAIFHARRGAIGHCTTEQDCRMVVDALNDLAAAHGLVRELTADETAGQTHDGAGDYCGYCGVGSLHAMGPIRHDPACPIVRGREMVAIADKSHSGEKPR